MKVGNRWIKTVLHGEILTIWHGGKNPSKKIKEAIFYKFWTGTICFQVITVVLKEKKWKKHLRLNRSYILEEKKSLKEMSLHTELVYTLMQRGS